MSKLNFRTGVFGGVVAGAVLLAGLAAPRQAEAKLILAFGQNGTANTVTGTDNGSGSTMLSASDVAITITALDGSNSSSISAYFNLLAYSTTAATLGANGNTRQSFTGTFEITSGTGETGTEYLGGDFIDLFEARNDSATLQASTPPAQDVNFRSTFISSADLGMDRAIALSFTSVNPNITGPSADGSIPSFTAAISGNFSADNNAPTSVPEPISMALLGVGLLGTGLVARRRSV